jgi:hypothetical protein
MTGTELLQRFELYVDDTSELSTTEELALMNEKYREICSDRAWEFLKTAATGTQSTTVPYIALPTGFRSMIPNHNFTENTSPSDETSAPIVVFVGTGYRPYKVINWSDRRQYRDQDGYAYIDYVNSRLYFAKQPVSAESYEFDYVGKPTDILAGTQPLIPEDYQPLLYLDMAMDNDIIQRFEKARSYLAENREKREAIFRSLCLWNSQFHMN